MILKIILLVQESSDWLLPDKSQHGLRGDGGRRRHDDQRFPQQHELPEDVQVDEDRLETPAQIKGHIKLALLIIRQSIIISCDQSLSLSLHMKVQNNL